ncbi:MAG: methionine adenosyltransferase domain-containing protein [Actinomycetota bacterium]
MKHPRPPFYPQYPLFTHNNSRRPTAIALVAAGAASRCEIQVAYAIGMARPMSVLVETFGTEKVSKDAIEKAVDEVFDLRPGAIMRDLDLRRPIYRKTAAYGHFGREPEDGTFPWEQTNKVDDLKSALGL